MLHWEVWEVVIRSTFGYSIVFESMTLSVVSGSKMGSSIHLEKSRKAADGEYPQAYREATVEVFRVLEESTRRGLRASSAQRINVKRLGASHRARGKLTFVET